MSEEKDVIELGEAVKHFNERSELEAKEAPAEPAVELIPRTRTPAEILELAIVGERFKASLKERSFSGRNPELGPMIKCQQCGQRHRDNVKHEPIKYKAGTTQVESGRPVANPVGWRAKPGKMMWIEQLKKFVTITR